MLSASANHARRQSDSVHRSSIIPNKDYLENLVSDFEDSCSDHLSNDGLTSHLPSFGNKVIGKASKIVPIISNDLDGLRTLSTPLHTGKRTSISSERYSITKRLQEVDERDSRRDSSDSISLIDDDIHYNENDPDNTSIHSSEDNSVSRFSMSRDKKELKNKSCYILNPYNKRRISWDMLMAWILAWMSFYIPYRVCMYWDLDTTSDTLVWFEVSIDIIFTIDIILNFITAYHDPKKNVLITSFKLIAARYLKGYFFVDAVATFPFGLILTNSTGSTVEAAGNIGKLGRLPKMIKLLRAMRLLKLLRVYKLQQFIERLEVEYNIHHGISRLLKIMLMVLLVTHVVGCFWYLVGLSGGRNIISGGWMFRQSFAQKDIPSKYVASLYWAFSTLTTVGYGDISARTPQEQVYSMLMMLLGVSWYAYVVSSMSSVMSTFNAQNKAVRDKMMCVNEFIRATKLPKALAREVRDLFDFRLSRSQRMFLMADNYEADVILSELNSGLRAEVLLFLERDLVHKIPFFDDKIPQFVADMVCLLQPVVVQGGAFIIKEGDQADEMYFLIEGKAGIYYGQKKALTIHAGSYFGEIGCLMGGIRRATVKALCTCELQSLSKRNLNGLLAEYPDVYDELRGVASERKNETDSQKIAKTRNRKTKLSQEPALKVKSHDNQRGLNAAKKGNDNAINEEEDSYRAKKSETINGKDTKMCSKQEIPKRKRKSEQNKDTCEGVKKDVLLRFSLARMVEDRLTVVIEDLNSKVESDALKFLEGKKYYIEQ